MPVMALLNLATPTNQALGPSSIRMRSRKMKQRPGLGVCRVLNDSSISLYCGNCREEATAVIADVYPGPTPIALARRMRHNRPRPRVQSRVARFVPRINAFEAEITTASGDIQSRNHRFTLRARPVPPHVLHSCQCQNRYGPNQDSLRLIPIPRQPVHSPGAIGRGVGATFMALLA